MILIGILRLFIKFIHSQVGSTIPSLVVLKSIHFLPVYSSTIVFQCFCLSVNSEPSLNNCELYCNFSDVHTAASAFTGASQSTNGQESNRSVTTQVIQRNLPLQRQEFNRLKLRLRELSPEDSLFAEATFSDDPFDSLSLNSSASTELAQLYKLTKANNVKLRARIGELEPGLPHLS